MSIKWRKYNLPEPEEWVLLIPLAIMIQIVILCFVPSCGAYLIEKDEALHCIIGEAASEGVVGMTAVSEAIRNRGHLNGVYGCKSEMPTQEPAWVWRMAEDAWEASKTSNLVKGATHWESTDFPEPWWAPKMIKVTKIGKHIFYKERTK